MKLWVSHLLGVTLSVLFIGVAQAGVNQWTTNGPAGRSANALVVDPKNPATLYVGTEEGVFKSTDSAESWLKLSLPFAAEVRALTIDPNNPATLYASYSQRIPLPDGFTTAVGVLKSSDGGVSWMQASVPSGDYRCDTVFAVAPTTPTSVYLHCNEASNLQSGLFKSVDDGRSWTLLGLPQNGGIQRIVVDPTTPTTIYTVTSSGTFRSVDSGGTWIDFEGPRFDTPTKILDLAIAPSVPHTMYANVYATTDGYLFDPVGTYQSTDGGKSWTAHLRVGPSVVFDPVHPDSLYYGESLVSQTIDGGRNWLVLNEGLPVGIGVQAFVIDPRSGSTLYAGITTGTDTSVQGLVYKRQIVGTPPIGVMGTVESPEDGQPISGIGFLRGWVFSTWPEDSYARVFVTRADRFDTGSQYSCCTLRYDVQAAFPQFPPEHTLNSGWGTMMNWGTLSAGSHRLQAAFDNLTGDIHHPDPRTVIVIKPGDFEYLERFSFSDAQASIIGDELVVQGVVVQDVFTKQQKRIDVRYRWFTNQQSLGLVNSETAAALSSGPSQVTTLLAAVVRRLGKTPDLIPSVQAAQSIFSNFESPNERQIASGIGILRGWSFGEVPPDRWERYRIPSAPATHLLVDGKVYDRITCCGDREDVAAAFPDKAHAIISGWATQLNYGEFDPGEHTLSVEISGGQNLTHKITTSRIGGFRFLDQFNLISVTARIEGEEVVLSGVQVRDKASQQTKVIEVRLRWFQHSQALGIVASSM